MQDNDIIQKLMIDPDKHLRTIEKLLSQDSLAEYVTIMWSVLEPGREFKRGWHIDCICDHLTALHNREIRKLLIMVPPGSSKSLLSQVFFPTWVWGPKEKPHEQFLGFSYSQNLAERDNVKCRTLIRSPEYQNLWGDCFSLTRDTNSKSKFANDKNGFKQVSSVGGTSTGLRADTLMIDDPMSVKQCDSEADIKTALNWFNETMPTRINSAEDSCVCCIMQRIHERDVAGEIMSKDLGYEKVVIPMEAELERRCYTVVHPGGFVKEDKEPYLWDKRTEEGELMCPELFPREYVDSLKKQLGPYAAAGQLQQRPTPREGSMIKTADIRYIKKEDLPKDCIEVRGWDLAGSTTQKSPYTAGVKMLFDDKGNFYIADCVRFKAEERQVVNVMYLNAQKDGKDCVIDFPQDPGQAGKAQAVYIKECLAGFVVKSSIESGSKTLRAEALADQFSIGRVYIVEGEWNEDYVQELTTFPGSRFKDQVDATSRAFHRGLEMRNREIDNSVCSPVFV